MFLEGNRLYALCYKLCKARKALRAYTVDEVAVASRVLDLLIFLACSRTLDLASSMDTLEPATVERARANCAGVATFEADDTRILEAERDMLAAALAMTATTGQRTGQEQGGVQGKPGSGVKISLYKPPESF